VRGDGEGEMVDVDGERMGEQSRERPHLKWFFLHGGKRTRCASPSEEPSCF